MPAVLIAIVGCWITRYVACQDTYYVCSSECGLATACASQDNFVQRIVTCSMLRYYAHQNWFWNHTHQLIVMLVPKISSYCWKHSYYLDSPQCPLFRSSKEAMLLAIIAIILWNSITAMQVARIKLATAENKSKSGRAQPPPAKKWGGSPPPPQLKGYALWWKL